MAVDEVIVTNINRKVLMARADNETKEIFADNEIEFEFIYLINNQPFESKTTLKITDNKTISELEELIKDIMNSR